MKLHYPYADRNKGPILEVLREVLPSGATVLEIASGTGQHALHFSQALDVHWQPSDIGEDELASIRAYREEGPDTFLDPVRLDVTENPWPITSADAIVTANLIHITPWSCTRSLVAGAGRILSRGGILFLYGPFKIDGEFTTESNREFDQWLRDKDPSFGVRDLDEVSAVANDHGLVYERRVAMPANNFSVIFRRA